MHCKAGNVLSTMLNTLRKCEFYIYIKKCHHILNMIPDFPSKRIDLCHKISIILVFTCTRPNSTKNMFVPNKPFVLRKGPLRQL